MEETRSNVSPNEETPLLNPSEPTRAPLPKLQIAIILLLQVCEPICSQSIYPYINELVGTLDVTGGDERKVGYFAGLIESLFFATEAITVFQWSRLSDRIGRKSVLLIGLLGLMLSMLFFGLSRTFLNLVISRCLCGLLNGNIGVIKSVMGELTDSTNRPDVYALMPPVWAFGATMGPLLGGTLARPADHFPTVFGAKFWGEFPYFLPCLATSSFVLVVLVITAVFFKETLLMRKKNLSESSTFSESWLESSRGSHYSDSEVSLKSFLIFPIIIPIANYVALAFLSISVNSLLPLFFHMPVEMGGLGLDPDAIGCIIGIYGTGTGVFQYLYFARLVRHFGTRRVFIMSMATFVPIFLIFPFVNLLARMQGSSYGTWTFVGLMLFLLFFTDTAYGCILMHVTECVPDSSSLGAVNGLSQTVVSIARAVGPALSTSLYCFSIQNDLIGGYGVYVILAFLSALALFLAILLPQQPRTTTETVGNVTVQCCPAN
ncbi:major facilitator superfamily domain-containing protein [Gymnopilus junonius]|uniref:Major facilitator superfamily domain-containing protein n=1 Tax=Gymnopilus junonius TaxID=109634 RepID=A0A9P5NDN2_GYMJU|nr:major facilitator superfamily domain-containing protein [Gymnopilus junonius]